jgi:hypothetical protein
MTKFNTKIATSITAKYGVSVDAGPSKDGKHFKTKVSKGGRKAVITTSVTPRSGTPASWFETDVKKFVRGTI